jgi:hypothetical protein
MPNAGGHARSRVITAASILSAGLLFIRLAGLGRAWLPGPLQLAALLVLLLFVQVLLRRPHAEVTFAWREFLSRHAFELTLVGLTALALAVRLPQVGSGLWHSPIDIDEERLALNVQHFFLTGEIGHLTVEHYPGVVFWLIAASSLFTYLWALLRGAILTINDMSVEWFTLAGRLTNVFLAAATATLAGLMGKEAWGPAAGLLGAALVAIAPLSVDVSTILRNDPGQTLFAVGTVYAALVAYRSGGLVSALSSGALAGAATGIKYTSVFALVPAVLAVSLVGPVRTRLERAGAVVAAFAIALAVTNHFLWADFPNFLAQLSKQVEVWGPSDWPADRDPARLYIYILHSFGPGWPLLVLGAAYGAYELGTGRAEAWVFWAFPVLYMAFATARVTQFTRWVLPLLPFACVAGTAGLVMVVRLIIVRPGRTGSGVGWMLRGAATACLLVMMLAKPLWIGAVSFSRRLTAPTDRLTEQWLETHAVGGRVLVEDHWLVLNPSLVRVHRVPDLRAALSVGRYELSTDDWVVVPETSQGLHKLQGLLLAARFDADQGFRGHLGYDYRVYATPRLGRTDEVIDIRLDDPAAGPFLGSDWRFDHSAEPGLTLPASGASLFLPPRVRERARVELEILGATGPHNEAPVELSVAHIPVALDLAGAERKGLLRVNGVARLPGPAKVTEVRLQPIGHIGPLRIARIRID